MKDLRSAGLPALSVVLTCLFPCVFLFCLNADEAKYSHIFPYLVVFLLMAVLLLLPPREAPPMYDIPKAYMPEEPAPGKGADQA